MKCNKCPLLKCYRCSYEYDEYDICCLADYKNQDFPENVDPETNGCKRTNKWILQQSKEELELKHEEYDCDCWIEYMKKHYPDEYKEHFEKENIK